MTGAGSWLAGLETNGLLTDQVCRVYRLQFPTFRAYPLQPECDNWCEFPVKDRPNAVVQFLMAAEQHPELIQGAWLLMLESDYVWMKPMQVRGHAPGAALCHSFGLPDCLRVHAQCNV